MIVFYAKGQQRLLGKNIISAEFSKWGKYSALSYTANIDHIVAQKGSFSYYGRLGGGIWAPSMSVNGMLFLPKFNLGFGALLGKRSHHFDVQAGPEIYLYTGSNLPDGHIKSIDLHVYALAGYRYQKLGHPFMFRVAIATYGKACVALGYSF